MFPAITSLYAGLLGLLLLALSLGVSRQRLRHKVSHGDGGVPELISAIRAHANFTEYVPLSLLLILLLELSGHHAWLIHGLGAALFISRILHAQGMSGRKGPPSFGRKYGTVLAWLVLLVSAVLLLASASFTLFTGRS